MDTKTKRFEGGSFNGKLGPSSKLCSDPTHTLYGWAYWEVPLEVHTQFQAWPMASGWNEAKPMEYNV